jgi:hypothetical protein
MNVLEFFYVGHLRVLAANHSVVLKGCCNVSEACQKLSVLDTFRYISIQIVAYGCGYLHERMEVI